MGTIDLGTLVNDPGTQVVIAMALVAWLRPLVELVPAFAPNGVLNAWALRALLLLLSVVVAFAAIAAVHPVHGTDVVPTILRSVVQVLTATGVYVVGKNAAAASAASAGVANSPVVSDAVSTPTLVSAATGTPVDASAPAAS